MAYLLVFFVFFCVLDDTQKRIGTLVAARELLYIAGTVLASATCPVFLLLDPFTLWKEAPLAVDRWTRALAYTLTPHNYTMVCLAHRHTRYSRLFVMLAFFQAVADFASCVALFQLLLQRTTEGDKFKLNALVVGYLITAVGFLLFWGPLSVSTAYRTARDAGNGKAKRWTAGTVGVILFAGLLYILLGYVFLLPHTISRASEQNILRTILD
eukprot:COSAG05_NODE_5568_length_1138_cov_0.974013_1_plen_212_part_00